MLGVLHRYIKGTGYCHSILSADEFAGSREVLNGKAMTLREKGKGKRKRKADCLTAEEEEAMWQSGVLGYSTPQSLNFTVFFQTSQHFGTRGCQEHHQICIEDLKFVRNPTTGEPEYVEWVEGITKTRQGGLVKKERRVPQRMFATGEDRCPVAMLMKLISKRPESLRSSGPLYLTPLQNIKGKDTWFSKQRVGVNKINGYIKEMTYLAGLQKSNKRYTNHSVRKTTVRKLQKAGFSNDKIASITGHKSEQTLREYSETDMDDHRQISHTLAQGKPAALRNITNNPSALSSYTPESSLYTVPQMAPYSHLKPACTPPWPMATYNCSHCTLNFHYTTTTSTASSSSSTLSVTAPRKRARIIEDSDSD